VSALVVGAIAAQAQFAGFFMEFRPRHGGDLGKPLAGQEKQLHDGAESGMDTVAGGPERANLLRAQETVAGTLLDLGLELRGVAGSVLLLFRGPIPELANDCLDPVDIDSGAV
jgi:hypothetical protein